MVVMRSNHMKVVDTSAVLRPSGEFWHFPCMRSFQRCVHLAVHLASVSIWILMTIIICCGRSTAPRKLHF
ncbi:hypothetical protein GDO78_023065 [Eleutherodactylus coqui]|uniref:Uncharacterized protein n=1 Tax=Eleutherodactylus coqui TaxID=57060 RepID=A0A8J6EC44_ELECQ|nr:hypothetical protein GDO78_023065 [Eleutherodactylus coqui]